jgi:hypothetical protein
LNFKEEVLCKILQILLEKQPRFFKVIEHKSGRIIQIQIKLYNEIRCLIEKGAAGADCLRKDNSVEFRTQAKLSVGKLVLQGKGEKKKKQKETKGQKERLSQIKK